MLTESAGEFRFDEGREVELKAITGMQQVHAVEWRRSTDAEGSGED